MKTVGTKDKTDTLILCWLKFTFPDSPSNSVVQFLDNSIQREFQRNRPRPLVCFRTTDDVTILMRFEPSSCSLKRLRASMKISNFERKYSPEYCHMICIGKTKATNEKVCCEVLGDVNIACLKTRRSVLWGLKPRGVSYRGENHETQPSGLRPDKTRPAGFLQCLINERECFIGV